MLRHRVHVLRCVELFVLVLVVCAVTASAQTTSFTYQGKLSDGGGPATGAYDFQFTLWDALSGGAQQPQPSPATVTKTNVAVTGGIFTVQLDFGATAFPGADRYLEIGVRPTGGGGFAILSPRQPVNSTPYSLRSLSTTTADALSTACVNCVTSAQIQSVQGSQISSPIPVADVPAGSGNYIQNSTNQQVTSNFNISGAGTAGGTLSGNIVNASTQFNLGGSRVLAISGGNIAPNSNTFAGVLAGVATTPSATGIAGNLNSFFGNHAGEANTTGFSNAFLGAYSGASNLDGSDNSFFGRSAGALNVHGIQNSFFGNFSGVLNSTGGFNAFLGYYSGHDNNSGDLNSFFGSGAGAVNQTGSYNSAFGSGANFGGTNLVNSTSIGANARVDVNNALVLGSVNGINGATANTMVGIGTTTPGTALDVQNNTSSVAFRLSSNAGSSTIYLVRALAIAANSSQIQFYSAGNPDFSMGTSQGSAGVSDFSIYNYGTNSNVFTIQKSNGNIGIGTVTPGYRLHVDQTTPNAFATHIQTEGLATGTSYGLVVSAGTNSSDISFQSRNQAGSSMFMVRGDGLVNIANTLSVTGSASIGGNLTLGGGLQLQNMIGPGGLSVCVNSSGPPFVLVVCSSSYRYKTNINNFREGLSIINRLKPIGYAWKIGGQPDIGFGAEDVESIDRRLVFYNDKGQVEGVKYDRIGVVLVNAVKEQQAQIEKLQEQLTRQQEQITQQQRQAKQQQASFAAQQQQIDALKKLVCRKHPRTNVRRMN